MKDRWITDWDRGEPDWMPYYTRANAGETLPDPASPLGWTFAWEQGFVPGWVRGMEQVGIYREGEFPRQRPAQLGMFGGYFYINLSHMRLMTMRLGGSAESADAAWVGSRADVPPYLPHPRDDDPEQSAKAAATIAEVFARTSWPEIDEALANARQRRAARPDLDVMSDAELVRYARRFQPELEQDWIWHVWASLSASIGPGVLAALAADRVCGQAVCRMGRAEAVLPPPAQDRDPHWLRDLSTRRAPGPQILGGTAVRRDALARDAGRWALPVPRATRAVRHRPLRILPAAPVNRQAGRHVHVPASPVPRDEEHGGRPLDSVLEMGSALGEERGFDVLSAFGDLLFQPPIYPLLEMARGLAAAHRDTRAVRVVAGAVTMVDETARPPGSPTVSWICSRSPARQSVPHSAPETGPAWLT